MRHSTLRRLALFAVLLACLWTTASSPAAEALHLSTRRRQPATPDTNRWQVVERAADWDPRKTAIVICDMWDKHWCAGATRRVAEMAPRLNEVVKKARAQGVLIVHCPSDTMKHYEGTPARQLAQAAPVVTPKVPLQRWCSLDRSREAPLPIDDSDGGCDDWPACKNYTAWSQQHPALEIQAGDAVTDSAEAYYLMQQRGIENVIVMGVHLNMCVLGRPFSIRQMISQGKNVVLMRDLTDTMYNSRQRPYVPHAVGTALMIEHVEKYWCPTITSVAFLGGAEFRFAEDRRPHVVFLIGEDEYQTWETLPAFAQSELEWRGIRVSVIPQDPANKHNFPGLIEALRDADALLVSVRRRGLPREQLDAVRAHLDAGRPLIGIRTACHAFAPREGDPEKGAGAWWPAFDPDVFGGHYVGHHGAGTQTSIHTAPGAEAEPLLTGVTAARLTGHGSLYRVNPLKPTTRPLLIGSVPDKPEEPVAWTHTFGPKQAKIFYTSLGHPDDFADPTFRRLLLNAVLWAVGQPLPPAAAAAAATAPAEAKKFAASWQTLAVPGTWEDLAGLNYDGFAWYRCLVKVPAEWGKRDVTLAVESVDNVHEAYFNGTRIGGAGRFPPQYQNGIEFANRYVVPTEKLRAGEWNVVAIRVFDHDGRGGFKGAAPQLGTDRQHLSLQGDWQFRTGDDMRWGSEPMDPGTSDLARRASFSRLEEGAVPRGSGGHKMAARGEPLTPAESARSFTVPEDLEFEQVLAEPLVRQPVFLNFDERGRMWVVQYIQYPAPAGLNVVSKDVWWRAVYDKVPEPPPRGVRGEDKITIHEDTDGDGKFDKHTTFVDGLNIATAVAQGRGGVWVLNPPYLLFYPDANHDDVPDGPPVVHLEGFGLEDTHSVINSLRWGSDGWLYAAQGSTVTGRVRAPATPGSASTNVVLSQGQNIWRYHPETHRYEIFAEGGGNAFGVEMDDKGRVYSGHNGGDTRGFHYLQGAYLRKGFEKHGELSNPYAFGYFPNMTGTPGERFTHNFVINHGGALPARYDGMLFGIEPLQGRVVLSEITPEGSTFKTRDLERVVTSRDSWFRPVDIKVGPDGAIYVCDWYDRQVTHTRNQEGNIDTSNGRIYRLKAKGAKPLAPFNLAALSNEQLIGLLNHSNTWFRQTIQRVIADRHEASLGPRLQQLVAQSSGQLALEALWACHNSGGLTEAAARSFLDHPEPQVRLWTLRLLGDDRTVSPALLRQFVELAGREPNVEVRAQLAATAQRLPAADGLAIVGRLALHDEDVKDPRVPLLCWWAMEKQCEAHRDAVLRLFEDSAFWNRPMVEQHLLERVMRRFAAAGARRDLLTCARLLELAPLREHSERLMKGFEAAYQGRSMAGVPEEVIQAMTRHGVGSPAFRLRQGAPDALPQALKTIADAKANRQERQRFVQILGEVRQPAAVPALLQLVEQPADAELRRSALNALAAYDELDIGRRVAAVYPALTGDVRTAAQTLLSSRTAWSLQLVQAVDRGQVRPLDVPREIVAQMKLHKDPQLAGLLRRYWPEPAAPGGAAWQSQIQHFGDVLKAGKGDPYRGQALFNASCASCHTLFARGGHVGPDLTSYQRSDLDFLLLNIVNPSAQIREGYENFVVETKDDRALNGFLVERDSRLVVLRGLDGQNITLERKDIVDLRAASLSLMPEGLLDALSDQQVRDLFAFLRSTQPLAN